MPNVPTFVVAIIASEGKETSKDILSQHQKFIELCHTANIHLLSIGGDGAPTELSAQAGLETLTSQYLRFKHEALNVYIKIPLVGNPLQPLVGVQDPKHAKKTAANQFLSGARLLALGKYYACVQQLAQILQMSHSPLVTKDVIDSDKQDDGRAFRILSWQTLEASLSQESSTGLSILLFVFGEMTDVWLNQEIGHRERIQLSWTASFFIRRWKSYLKKRQEEPNSMMSVQTNGISPQSFNIFETLGPSLLSLIISHREYYADYPLMPWKHGSEPCEHIFGWMRVISPNFSVLDARLMVPKIHAIVKSIVQGKMKMAPSEHMHAGYQHAFSQEHEAMNTKSLSYFPTNAELSEDLEVASKRANKLIHFCGMGHLDPSEDEIIDDDFPNISSFSRLEESKGMYLYVTLSYLNAID